MPIVCSLDGREPAWLRDGKRIAFEIDLGMGRRFGNVLPRFSKSDSTMKALGVVYQN